MFNILILNKSNNTFTTICSVEDEEQLVEISENLQSCLPEYLQVGFEVVESEEGCVKKYKVLFKVNDNEYTSVLYYTDEEDFKANNHSSCQPIKLIEDDYIIERVGVK